MALRGQISSDVVNEPLGGKMPCILGGGSVPLFGFGCTKMTPILLVTIPPVFTHEIKTGLSEGGMIVARVCTSLESIFWDLAACVWGVKWPLGEKCNGDRTPRTDQWPSNAAQWVQEAINFAVIAPPFWRRIFEHAHKMENFITFLAM